MRYSFSLPLSLAISKLYKGCSLGLLCQSPPLYYSIENDGNRLKVVQIIVRIREFYAVKWRNIGIVDRDSDLDPSCA